MRHHVLGAAALSICGATAASASSISFYASGTTSTPTTFYGLSQNDGASGAATIDRKQRILTVDPFTEIPQFAPGIGTLTRVDLYFGILNAPSSTNRVAVSLDDDCLGCEKDVSIDVSFGFGADIIGFPDLRQSGPIRQFFAASEQSFIEFGSFDNDAATPFRPLSGEVALTPGSLDGEYALRSFTGDDLVIFTGSGDLLFDVFPAISIRAGLSCRDPMLNQVGCSEVLEVETGGVDWAIQVVYHYVGSLDLGITDPPPDDPFVIYSAADGFLFLPPGAAPGDLTFFGDDTPFRPEPIPLPATALLVLSGLAAMAALRRRRT